MRLPGFYITNVFDEGFHWHWVYVLYSHYILSFCMQICGFQTASEYSIKRKHVFHVTTGSLEFE